MHHENLISTLSKIDFKTHTIKPNDQNGGVEVAEKSKSLWQGRVLDVEEFDKALNNLLIFVRSNPEDFEKQVTSGNLFELANKLFEESKSIKSHTEAHSVQEKIHKIVSEVLLQRWSHSEGSIRDAVVEFTQKEDQSTEIGWKNFFTSQFLTENGELFLINDTLGISASFIEKLADMKDNSADDKSINEQLKKIFNRHPEISIIHIQGNSHPILREEFLKALRDQLPLTTFLTPVFFIGNNKNNRIMIHPALILNSEYVKNHLKFNGCSTRDVEDIHLEQIDFEIIALINSHASDDFSKIEVNELNLIDLYRAADYLQLEALRWRCNNFISKAIRAQTRELPKEEHWELALQWASVLQPMMNKTLNRLILDQIETDLDLNALNLIKQYNAEDYLKHLLVRIHFGIHLNHVTSFAKIADYLQLTSLKDRCENLILAFIRSCRRGLKGKELWEVALKWNLRLKPVTSDALSSLLSEALSNSESIEDLLLKLESIKEQGLILHSLDLSRMWQDLGDKDLKTIIESIPNITHLNLEKCIHLTDAIGPELAKLKKLKDLNLVLCLSITDGIGPELAKLPNLKNLQMDMCHEITDAIIPQLAKLEQLTNLHLSNCNNLTDSIIPELANFKELEALDIANCSKLREINVDSLFIKLKKLTRLTTSDGLYKRIS